MATWRHPSVVVLLLLGAGVARGDERSAVLGGCSTPMLVRVATFQSRGEALPDVAIDMSRDIATALDAHPNVDVITSKAPDGYHPASYLLTGTLWADDKRRYAELRLLKADSGRRTWEQEYVWANNYDYTNVHAEMIAQDILMFLDRPSLCG